MVIQFSSGGGIAYIPGLNTSITIETDQLPAAEADDFKKLIEDAHFFDQPPVIMPPPGAADFRQYTISVKDGDRQHTVRFTNLGPDPKLLALRDRLNKKADELKKQPGNNK